MKDSLLTSLKIRETETIHMPFIFFKNKLFILTNSVCQDNKTGDKYFLGITKKGDYILIHLGVDRDCDGIFYFTYIVEDFEIDEKDFEFFNFDDFSKIMKHF